MVESLNKTHRDIYFSEWHVVVIEMIMNPTILNQFRDRFQSMDLMRAVIMVVVMVRCGLER